MNALDPSARYRAYLATFGIADAGDRAVALRDLDTGSIRFFAYAGGEGLRLKAAVTPRGVVRPGRHTGDDWYGLLSGVPDAEALAERIAWLETEAALPPHGLPRPPVVALTPDRRPARGIDPAEWAFVTPPTLREEPGGGKTLAAWFLPSDARRPERWTVSARREAPAVIGCASALELLEQHAGSAAAAAARAEARARQLLAEGEEDERGWALQHVGETGARAAAPAVAALLANEDAGPHTRLRAAGTLARLGDPAAGAALGRALRADPAPEVRRAAAHALGRIGGTAAVEALAEAASGEPDALVRAEIVHALAAQGHPARAALDRIAHDDLDPHVCNLARGSLDAMG